MYEKVNPSHPDKLADRIAGALVDLAYAQVSDPRIAVEVLLGHGICHIIAETDISLPLYEVTVAVERIAGKVAVDYVEVAQDRHLAKNLESGFHCGDNGIFKGVPVTAEQKELTRIAKEIYGKYKADGKSRRESCAVPLCLYGQGKSHLVSQSGDVCTLEDPCIWMGEYLPGRGRAGRCRNIYRGREGRISPEQR